MPLMAKPGTLYSIFGNYSLVYLVVSRGLDQQSHSSSTVSERMAAKYTVNVNRQTTDKLLFSYVIITGKNV